MKSHKNNLFPMGSLKYAELGNDQRQGIKRGDRFEQSTLQKH